MVFGKKKYLVIYNVAFMIFSLAMKESRRVQFR